MEYLDSIRNKLPADLFAFVSDPGRHDFSRRSLHDSRIGCIQCQRADTGETEMRVTLIGSEAAREFALQFQGVSRYTIVQDSSDIYSDLITFEVGVEKEDCENERDTLVFRALFACEKGKMEIFAEALAIKECIYEA